jgi:hypothetical protein
MKTNEMVEGLRSLANDPEALVSRTMLLDAAADFIEGSAAVLQDLRAENERLRIALQASGSIPCPDPHAGNHP